MRPALPRALQVRRRWPPRESSPFSLKSPLIPIAELPQGSLVVAANPMGGEAVSSRLRDGGPRVSQFVLQAFRACRPEELAGFRLREAHAVVHRLQRRLRGAPRLLGADG